jgi:hypothetical protein
MAISRRFFGGKIAMLSFSSAVESVQQLIVAARERAAFLMQSAQADASDAGAATTQAEATHWSTLADAAEKALGSIPRG